MVRKHISRDFTKHRRDVFRPYDEFYKVEIISYEHDLTRVYLAKDDVFKTTNTTKKGWKSWTTYIYDPKNNDKSNRFKLEAEYLVEEAGEYRIDIVYEIKQTEKKTTKKVKDKETGKTKKETTTKKVTENLAGSFMGEAILYEGTLNHVKRLERFLNFEEGNQTITLELPHNCYFYGLIIRKTKEFMGDSLGTHGSNLMLQKVDCSANSQIGTHEASFEIAYDNELEHLSTSTGLYIDYNDEVNIHFKGINDKEPTQIFGGYVSTIQADKNRTTLSVSCADRMVDGQNRYILSHMSLLGGATLPLENAYPSDMDIDFDTYGQALKYLCQCLEISLKNNIGNNDLVTGETAQKGFNIEFGKNKQVKKVTCKNATSEVSKNFITIRNKSDATKKQEIILYNGKDHTKTPVDITDYNNFGVVYGLGDREVVKEEKSITSGDGGSGSGAASIIGKQTIVLGLDINNSSSNDHAFQNGVARVLEKAGHTVIKLERAPNPFARYSYSGAAKGKIGVYLIAAGLTSIVDLYSGNTNFKYAYFGIRGDVTKAMSSINDFNNHGIGKDRHGDCAPASMCNRLAGKTYPQINEITKSKCIAVFGKTGEEMGNAILEAMGGSTTTTTTSSKKTTSKSNKKSSSKKAEEEDEEEKETKKEEKKIDIFKEVSDYAFKHFRYKLRGDTCSDAACMQKTGRGDCWAFSEFIFNQFKKNKINVRVCDYVTSGSNNHRSVQYMNSKREWVDFPYREYGWGTKYNNMLNNTSGSKHPNSIPLKYTAGGTIEQGNGTGVGSSTTTTNVKTTTGYSREHVIQGYFAITFSTEQSFKAKTKTVYVGFTQKSGNANSITGFSPIWINNTVKQLNVDVLDFIKTSLYREDVKGENKYYLHSIKFIAPKNKVVDSEKSEAKGKTVYKYEDWFTFDKSTHDYSSCKMDLYSLNFNNSTLINPTDLDSCGKNLNSLFDELITASKYTASRTYAKHRCDDVINFAVDNQTEAKFIATEGDENNILEINGISYTPRNNLFNNSTVVFKDATQKYKYVETRAPESVMKYGEQTTLMTMNEITGSKEAYYNALNSDKYNPSETFNFSLVLPYFVNIQVGDLVQVIANSRKLNTIKRVSSVKYSASHKQIPKIQTEVGLGELPIDVQIKKELREIRAMAKKETTSFSSTAEPIDDDSIYVWDN